MRVRVENRKLTEAEWMLARANDPGLNGPRRQGGPPANLHNPEYLTANPPPDRVVPRNQRSDRDTLIRIVDSYFDAITSHDGSVALTHPGCGRVENGSPAPAGAFLPPVRRAARVQAAAAPHPRAGRTGGTGRRAAGSGSNDCVAGLQNFNLSMVVARRTPLVDEEAQVVLAYAVFIRRPGSPTPRNVFSEWFVHRRREDQDDLYGDVLSAGGTGRAELAAVRRQLAAAGDDGARSGAAEVARSGVRPLSTGTPERRSFPIGGPSQRRTELCFRTSDSEEVLAMPAARVVVSILALGLLGATTLAQSALKPIPFSDTRLSNGLRVIISEDHYAPVFAIAVSYGVGSKDERAGRTGFAHLFEHMMFKGSENIGSGEHFFLVFNYGGSMNGTTNTDRTIYYEILPKNQLDLGLFLEADRMRSLAITKENLDNQRKAVQEERRLRTRQPAVRQEPGALQRDGVRQLRLQALGHRLDGGPQRRDGGRCGRRSSRRTTRRTTPCSRSWATSTRRRRSRRSRSTSAAFRGSRLRSRWICPRPELKAERRESMTDPLARVPRINMGYRIPPATHADWPALSVLGQILGGGESSRLYQAVVKEKELCTGHGAGSGARMGPALFYGARARSARARTSRRPKRR